MPADPDARLTVGRIEAEPGSINVVPARARFTVDLRHPDADRLAALDADVRTVAAEAADRHRCAVEIANRLDMPPARFSSDVTAAIAAAAAALGIPAVPMVSGAFHDALHVGRIAPAAMIFVPCRTASATTKPSSCPTRTLRQARPSCSPRSYGSRAETEVQWDRSRHR